MLLTIWDILQRVSSPALKCYYSITDLLLGEKRNYVAVFLPWKQMWIRPFLLADWAMALGVWERGLERIMALREGDIFVDVGSYIGYYSCLGARMVRTRGMVLAIEPDPRNVRLLRRNVSMFPQVTVIEAAVGPKKGSVAFGLGDTPLGSSLALRNQHPLVYVDMITLDDLVDLITKESSQKSARIVLKIDVEGAEVDVVRGGLTFIKRYLPTIVIESSKSHLNELKRILSNYDFKPLFKDYWISYANAA